MKVIYLETRQNSAHFGVSHLYIRSILKKNIFIVFGKFQNPYREIRLKVVAPWGKYFRGEMVGIFGSDPQKTMGYLSV